MGQYLSKNHKFQHTVDPQGLFGRMFRKLRIQGRMQIFEKMSQKALNRALALNSSGGCDLLQYPLKMMDLQNKNISVVIKHCTFRILAPMSYISFCELERSVFIERV